MESNSQSFIDAIRCFYMPRLVQKMEQNSTEHTTPNNADQCDQVAASSHIVPSSTTKLEDINFDSTKDTSSSNTSLSSVPEFQDQPTNSKGSSSVVLDDIHCVNSCNYDMDLGSMSASDIPFSGCHMDGNDWLDNDMAGDGMWDLDELWQFRKYEKDVGI
uniref:Uncharacterized protein n=2 Tax=Chenopodium quinoa TaxID=63459 RepID=A0A803KUZ0_CHEQI